MSIRDDIRGTVPGKLMQNFPGYFHLVGDIAIVSLPPELQDSKLEIAEGLIAKNGKIRTVLNKVSKLEGDRRVADFEVLAGGGTETVHRENGFLFHLDVARTFFNSRLSYEHARIASQVRPGEQVLVPFCGVGPFAVPIAARGATVVALEKNPEACRYLSENARLNKVSDRITIIRGDAFQAAKMLRTEFDRAVIPTPYWRDNILESIVPAVKTGGTIHFYTFKKKYQIPRLIEHYKICGLEVQLWRRCGNVAPGVSRWVIDMVKSQFLDTILYLKLLLL